MKDLLDAIPALKALGPEGAAMFAIAVVILLPLFLGVLSKLDSFYVLIQQARQRRLAELAGLSKLTQVSGQTKLAIDQAIDRLAFARLTGLNITKPDREAVHALVISSQGELEHSDFLAASQFVRFSADAISVEIPWYDIVVYRLVQGAISLALLLLLISGLLIVVATTFFAGQYGSTRELVATGVGGVLSASLLVMGLIFLMPPVHQAIKLQRKLTAFNR